MTFFFLPQTIWRKSIILPPCFWQETFYSLLFPSISIQSITGSNYRLHAHPFPYRVAPVWIWGIINCWSQWCGCCNLMFPSHQYPIDGWTVVELSVVETMGYVRVGTRHLILHHCGVRPLLAVVQQRQWQLFPCLPSSRRKGKEEEGFCSWGMNCSSSGHRMRSGCFLFAVLPTPPQAGFS